MLCKSNDGHAKKEIQAGFLTFMFLLSTSMSYKELFLKELYVYMCVFLVTTKTFQVIQNFKHCSQQKSKKQK